MTFGRDSLPLGLVATRISEDASYKPPGAFATLQELGTGQTTILTDPRYCLNPTHKGTSRYIIKNRKIQENIIKYKVFISFLYRFCRIRFGNGAAAKPPRRFEREEKGGLLVNTGANSGGYTRYSF